MFTIPSEFTMFFAFNYMQSNTSRIAEKSFLRSNISGNKSMNEKIDSS